ncbi:GlxA family transcriptional regulator [Caenispirillum salinarum]|uniref:GlxA family transcriptional regulator n=1 Tax=Caenispirillum salinarum TaxID=859058 RepID=UPI00384A8F44
MTGPGDALDGEGVRLRVAFVLLPNFTLLPFAGFMDVLRLAADEGDRSRQIACRWVVTSVDRAPVRASCGAIVRADCGFVDPKSVDYVVVVGGLLAGPPVDERVLAYLKEAAAAGTRVVGLCTGVFAMARAGLLEGRQCCVSWYHYTDLADRHPDVMPVADQLFVVDGPRITCAGGTGAIDLAAWLVDRHVGPAAAQKALHIMVSDGARPADAPQPHEAGASARPRDARLRRAVLILEQSFADPPSTDVLARRVGLSRRQLERLFRAEMDSTPAGYSRMVRLRHGRALLTRTQLSMTAIAHECGFADASHFARHLKAAFGLSPQAVRAAGGVAGAAVGDVAAAS